MKSLLSLLFFLLITPSALAGPQMSLRSLKGFYQGNSELFKNAALEGDAAKTCVVKIGSVNATSSWGGFGVVVQGRGQKVVEFDESSILNLADSDSDGDHYETTQGEWTLTIVVYASAPIAIMLSKNNPLELWPCQNLRRN